MECEKFQIESLESKISVVSNPLIDSNYKIHITNNRNNNLSKNVSNPFLNAISSSQISNKCNKKLNHINENIESNKNYIFFHNLNKNNNYKNGLISNENIIKKEENGKSNYLNLLKDDYLNETGFSYDNLVKSQDYFQVIFDNFSKNLCVDSQKKLINNININKLPTTTNTNRNIIINNLNSKTSQNNDLSIMQKMWKNNKNNFENKISQNKSRDNYNYNPMKIQFISSNSMNGECFQDIIYSTNMMVNKQYDNIKKNKNLDRNNIKKKFNKKCKKIENNIITQNDKKINFLNEFGITTANIKELKKNEIEICNLNSNQIKNTENNPFYYNNYNKNKFENQKNKNYSDNNVSLFGDQISKLKNINKNPQKENRRKNYENQSDNFEIISTKQNNYINNHNEENIQVLNSDNSNLYYNIPTNINNKNIVKVREGDKVTFVDANIITNDGNEVSYEDRMRRRHNINLNRTNLDLSKHSIQFTNNNSDNFSHNNRSFINGFNTNLNKNFHQNIINNNKISFEPYDLLNINKNSNGFLDQGLETINFFKDFVNKIGAEIKNPNDIHKWYLNKHNDSIKCITFKIIEIFLEHPIRKNENGKIMDDNIPVLGCVNLINQENIYIRNIKFKKFPFEISKVYSANLLLVMESFEFQNELTPSTFILISVPEIQNSHLINFNGN